MCCRGSPGFLESHNFQVWPSELSQNIGQPVDKMISNNWHRVLIGTFRKKCIFWTFWWFLGWIWAKLPLIQSKMRLQHNSLPFLPPAWRFSALWLGHAQKSKFWDRFWTRKWPTSLGFSILGIFFSPFLFLLFSCFCCSDWPSTGLACG